MPSTVTLSNSSASTTFAVTSKAVTTKTNVTISATYLGLSKTVAITVVPPGPSVLKLYDATAYGGEVVPAALAMNQTVAVNTAVALGSSNAAYATVPRSVTIPAGGNGVRFNVTPNGVATTQTVVITAVLNGISTTASFQILPSPLVSITVTSRSVASGSTLACTVHLNGFAPAGGAVVSLKSGSSAATVPLTVTVPAGTNNATFKITGATVTADTVVKISATLGSVTLSGNITVVP